MDIARAYSEVRSLPDEVLQKEMASPSGMLPGYLVAGEVNDRRAMRSGSSGSFAKKPTVVQQLMAGLPPKPIDYRPPPIPESTSGSTTNGFGLPSITPPASTAAQGLGAPMGGTPQVQGYSEGGLIQQLNPFIARTEVMQNPELGGQMRQELINEIFQNQPPLFPAMPAAAASGLPSLSELRPEQPGVPRQMAGGGLARVAMASPRAMGEQSYAYRSGTLDHLKEMERMMERQSGDAEMVQRRIIGEEEIPEIYGNHPERFVQSMGNLGAMMELRRRTQEFEDLMQHRLQAGREHDI